jgi:DNA-binding response OmpR family regulator
MSTLFADESNGANEVRGVNAAGEPVVLVADDERNIVDFLTDLLEDEGYEVIQAFDGEMALAEIDRTSPDLVIADVMMPRLDGLSLLRKLEERGKDIPVILMSAAVTPRSTSATFVPKPFDIDTMLSVIRVTIGDREEDQPTG